MAGSEKIPNQILLLGVRAAGCCWEVGVGLKESEVMRKPKLNSEKLLSQSGIELPPGAITCMV